MPIEALLEEKLRPCRLNDPFYQLTYFNLKVSLPEQMMVKVDKMSMAHSLETRAPFLDHRIVELLYRVHKAIKMPTYRDAGVKHILKQLMRNQLPASIIHRQKKGFEVPLRVWFREKEFDQRLDQDYGSVGFNQQFITEILAENKSGQFDHGTLIWRILLFYEWVKRF